MLCINETQEKFYMKIVIDLPTTRDFLKYMKKVYLLVNLHKNSPLLQTWQSQSMRKILEGFLFQKKTQNN